MRTSRPSEAAVEQRRQEILRHVIDHGELRIDVLAGHFGVSLMTMHRDLDDLAARQLLRKLRGRVAAFPSLTMETATRFREALHVADKDLLAAAVLDEVKPGYTIVMDDSTTLFPLARRLAAMEQLTVVTNSVRIAQILSCPNVVSVVLVGGRYQHEFDSCTGPDVLRFLARLRADVSFMSATAVAGGRLFHPIQDYAEIKEAISRAASRNILLADHHKFGKTATFGYGDVRAYNLVVTDTDTDPEELQAIRSLDVAVRAVDNASGEPRTVDHG